MVRCEANIRGFTSPSTIGRHFVGDNNLDELAFAPGATNFRGSGLSSVAPK